MEPGLQCRARPTCQIADSIFPKQLAQPAPSMMSSSKSTLSIWPLFILIPSEWILQKSGKSYAPQVHCVAFDLLVSRSRRVSLRFHANADRSGLIPNNFATSIVEVRQLCPLCRSNNFWREYSNRLLVILMRCHWQVDEVCLKRKLIRRLVLLLFEIR